MCSSSLEPRFTCSSSSHSSSALRIRLSSNFFAKSSFCCCQSSTATGNPSSSEVFSSLVSGVGPSTNEVELPSDGLSVGLSNVLEDPGGVVGFTGGRRTKTPQSDSPTQATAGSPTAATPVISILFHKNDSQPFPGFF
uniref:NADH-plastoquinone oxidoreductase subunit J n=1 Tax=Corydalis trisecta TaxID=2682942 RepID=A0A6B9QGS7_9MAGN|nr:NADH-plastoquinone oxidoreductase subunit J [Corydalis trisecta]